MTDYMSHITLFVLGGYVGYLIDDGGEQEITFSDRFPKPTWFEPVIPTLGVKNPDQQC